MKFLLKTKKIKKVLINIKNIYLTFLNILVIYLKNIFFVLKRIILKYKILYEKWEVVVIDFNQNKIKNFYEVWKKRPAIIISNDTVNKNSNKILVISLTTLKEDSRQNEELKMEIKWTFWNWLKTWKHSYINLLDIFSIEKEKIIRKKWYIEKKYIKKINKNIKKIF